MSNFLKTSHHNGQSAKSSKVVESLILEDVDEGESRSENVMSCIARTETIHSAVNPVKLPPTISKKVRKSSRSDDEQIKCENKNTKSVLESAQFLNRIFSENVDKKEVSTSSSNVLESSKKVYNSFEGEQPRAPQVANNLPGKQAVHNNKKDLRKKLSEIMGNSSVSSKMEDCKEMKNKEPEQEDGSQALPSDNTQSFEPDIILKSVDMNVKTSPIDLCSAMDLKRIVLGSAEAVFPESWRRQGFIYSSKLKYYLIQNTRGPCGVTSCVQSYILREALFSDSKRNYSSRSSKPNEPERSAILSLALANILWQAGQEKSAVVARLAQKAHFYSVHFKADSITERLMLATFSNFDSLLNYVNQVISQFQSEVGCGVILFIYSAILSRTTFSVFNDMDDRHTFIDSNGNCNQEIINLLLTGRAVSNYFNHNSETTDNVTGCVRLSKGIERRSTIGVLSILEHTRSIQVGTYLKTPKYPIWIVATENRFSVLYCTKKEIISDWKAERKFDIFYFDSVLKQDKEIRLTIDSTKPYIKQTSDSDNDDRISPIELCIRTKWNQADIDWNRTNPDELDFH